MAHISEGHNFHTLGYYQVLVGSMNKVSWVKGDPQIVPLNSVKGGYEANGEPIYIGRARKGAAIYPG